MDYQLGNAGSLKLYADCRQVLEADKKGVAALVRNCRLIPRETSLIG